jgi:hypothetical protein
MDRASAARFIGDQRQLSPSDWPDDEPVVSFHLARRFSAPESSKAARRVSRARWGFAGRLDQLWKRAAHRSGVGDKHWRMAWPHPWPPDLLGRYGVAVGKLSNLSAVLALPGVPRG